MFVDIEIQIKLDNVRNRHMFTMLDQHLEQLWMSIYHIDGLLLPIVQQNHVGSEQIPSKKRQ